MFRINYKLRFCLLYTLQHIHIISIFMQAKILWQNAPCLDLSPNQIPRHPLPHDILQRLEFKGHVSCVYTAAPFSFPIPLFFSSYCARMERSTTKVMDMDFLWFDSMKRSEEGTMKWQWGLHVALTGTAVVTPTLKWQGLKTFQGRAHQNQEGSLELWPHHVPNWPKCLFKGMHSNSLG